MDGKLQSEVILDQIDQQYVNAPCYWPNLLQNCLNPFKALPHFLVSWPPSIPSRLCGLKQWTGDDSKASHEGPSSCNHWVCTQWHGHPYHHISWGLLHCSMPGYQHESTRLSWRCSEHFMALKEVFWLSDVRPKVCTSKNAFNIPLPPTNQGFWCSWWTLFGHH